MSSLPAKSIYTCFRCSKAGQIKLTELDAEGRTFATYAIERGAHLCLKVCNTSMHGHFLSCIPIECNVKNDANFKCPYSRSI